MRTIAVTALALAAVGTLTVTAQAASINRRQHRQAHRIAQGVHSGELTRRETARLLAQQAYIRVEEARYRRSGGGLGPRERLDLQRDLNRASRNIFRQKHDRQER
ncbi:MAG: hypothetical protein ACRDGN_05015 [bacterium]